MRNIFKFTFLHNLRSAPSQRIDIDAYVVCHISINPSNPLNPLQDKKMGFENLMKFCKKFNHTDSEKHLERQEQLHENYRKIKLRKNCQRYMYNQSKKRPTTIALLPEEKQQVKYCARLWKHMSAEANASFVVEHVKKIYGIPTKITATNFRSNLLLLRK